MFEVLCNLGVLARIKLRLSIKGKKRQKGQQWTDEPFLILVLEYMKHLGSVWFTLVQYFGIRRQTIVTAFDRNCEFWFSLVQNFFQILTQKSAMVQFGSELSRPDARQSQLHPTKTRCFGSVWFRTISQIPTKNCNGSVWFSTFETRRKTVPVIFYGNEAFRLFGPVLRGIHSIFAASLGAIYIRENACILCRVASYTFEFVFFCFLLFLLLGFFLGLFFFLFDSQYHSDYFFCLLLCLCVCLCEAS